MIRRFPLGAVLISIGVGTAVLLLLLLAAPRQTASLSRVIRDREGNLLGAAVASDGQWRFPPGQDIPDRFILAVTTFEDKRFYLHPGVDPLSLARAAVQDIRAREIVSGGSTLTMQTVRLLSGNPARTFSEKIREAVLALVLELRCTKREILELYAGNAPFGGNVVGIEAASWRYFNRRPYSLTWAEAATLAVLPNQPALVHPGANRELLQQKRDRLLGRLFALGRMSENEYRLALAEPLPEKPWPLPRLAPHFLDRTRELEGPADTTIDRNLQIRVTEILERRSARLAASGIRNAAAIVLETKTGNIAAYVGNTGMERNDGSETDVDMIRARRSTGSLLKPFLYGAMLDAGLLMPRQLVVDIPTRIGSYKPENNVPIYQGVVRADQALSRSLNIPAVRGLREYGIGPFLDILRNSGFTTFTRTAEDYGLPLILGGGECTMEEAAHAYAALMNRAAGKTARDFASPCGFPESPLSRGAAWLTLKALVAGTRPEEEALWESWASGRNIAWKTGTSYGNRDSWAIGTTPDYTVAVWAGNATGEGRPELKSATVTAPMLFDIFALLPKSDWPADPEADLEHVRICSRSGYLASPSCDETETGLKPLHAPSGHPCPWCRPVSYSPDGMWRATAEDLSAIGPGTLPTVKNEFVLPPVLEWWYVRHAVNYRKLPPWIPGHSGGSVENDLSIAFPEEGTNAYIPVELDGTSGAFIMQAVSRERGAVLYWDLDGEYLGETREYHEMAVKPKPGTHVLTVTDSLGRSVTRRFRILGGEH